MGVIVEMVSAMRLAGRSENTIHFARFDPNTGVANHRLDITFSDWVDLGQPDEIVVTIGPERQRARS